MRNGGKTTGTALTFTLNTHQIIDLVKDMRTAHERGDKFGLMED